MFILKKKEREKKMEKELNTIEWCVYNAIKENSNNNQWTSMSELSQMFNRSNRNIRKIINKIRKNEKIQKIILTDYKNGYKLMTCEEEYLYLEKRKISLLKQLKQYYKDVKRFNMNNQFKITFGKYERDFIESILPIKGDVFKE